MRAKIYPGGVLLFSMNVCLAMGLVAQESRSPSRVPDEAPPMEQSKVKSLDESWEGKYSITPTHQSSGGSNFYF
ncbi:hypothetical protein OAH23_10085 [Verrucomicrobia bacterium]|nr:hypothetical protein [Verrucomicrobiota bacterium]MDB4690755.1 hypothetical protein [Verrucomicrobiota bacterium]